MVTQKPMVAEGAHGGTGAPLSHPPFPAAPPNNQKCLAKFKKLDREQTLQRERWYHSMVGTAVVHQ